MQRIIALYRSIVLMIVFPGLESWERVLPSCVSPQPRSQCFTFVYQERREAGSATETPRPCPAQPAGQATPSLARHARAMVQVRGKYFRENILFP